MAQPLRTAAHRPLQHLLALLLPLFCRITYLSPASLWHNHSAPLHSPSLQSLNALLLGPGCLCPDLPISPADQLLPAAAAAAARAVLTGGRVLVPVLPASTQFELSNCFCLSG
jgi:hypothetical protein